MDYIVLGLLLFTAVVWVPVLAYKLHARNRDIEVWQSSSDHDRKRYEDAHASLIAMALRVEQIECQLGLHSNVAIVRITGDGEKFDTSFRLGGETFEGIRLASDCELIRDGYDITANGTRYARIQPGRRVFWIELDGAVLYATSRKPVRVVNSDGKGVEYTWAPLAPTVSELLAPSEQMGAR